MNEKNKIEALLFATAKRMHIEEIAKLTSLRNLDKIKAALAELKIEYDDKGSSMVLSNDGDFWKLTVRDHYMPIVRKVVSQTELERPLMQTLAVVAWKYPVVQADVIKIRHNKAYDHLKRLEELGFVTRQNFGRTRKITLTQKFFEYFDLPTKEEAKALFSNIMSDEMKQNIEKTEKDIDEGEKKIEEHERKRQEMEEKRKLEKAKPEPKLGEPPVLEPSVEPEPKPDEPPVPVPETED